MKITTREFGTTKSGEAVQCVRMEHDSGIVAEVLNYGAILRAVWVPTANGPVQVARGYETLEEYEAGDAYLGAVVGRCAGRIAKGRFVLNDREYQLPCNQNGNHLHGGIKGFDRYVWDVQMLPKNRGVRFFRRSEDGEEGYPGAVEVSATYLFEEDGALTLRFDALALDDTILSMTHHGYWNLEGEGSTSVAGQLFSTPADCFAEIGEGSIPTGQLIPTAGTPFDFAAPAALGERWEQDHPQLAAASGFDHTFLVPGKGLRPMCRLECPANGISLQVSATLPGIHLYTANFLKPVARSAAALECQFIPDAPNHSRFPSIELPKGKRWEHQIQYRFAPLA